MRRYMKTYRQSEHNRIANLLRVRTRAALLRPNAKKSLPTLAMLGCTVPQLAAHLKSYLPDDQTDLSGYEIDHIRPCVSFDLTDAAQQRACFHYSNLQPLSRHANRSKGGKF